MKFDIIFIIDSISFVSTMLVSGVFILENFMVFSRSAKIVRELGAINLVGPRNLGVISNHSS